MNEEERRSPEKSELSSMFVSKEEKLFIEIHRLYQHFLNDPDTPLDPHNSTKYNIFKKAEVFCPSYTKGDILPIHIIETYLQALIKFLELNYQQMLVVTLTSNSIP